METVKSGQIVACLRTAFPKFSRSTLCMVRNPEYGCVLSKDAEKLLKETYPSLRLTTTPKKKKSAQRKKSHHLTLRLDDEAYAKFEQAKSDASTQQFLEKLLEEYYER